MLMFLGGLVSGTTLGMFIMASVTLAKEADRAAGILDLDDSEQSIRRWKSDGPRLEG
jgi:hypothetical protein